MTRGQTDHRALTSTSRFYCLAALSFCVLALHAVLPPRPDYVTREGKQVLSHHVLSFHVLSSTRCQMSGTLARTSSVTREAPGSVNTTTSFASTASRQRSGTASRGSRSSSSLPPPRSRRATTVQFTLSSLAVMARGRPVSTTRCAVASSTSRASPGLPPVVTAIRALTVTTARAVRSRTGPPVRPSTHYTTASLPSAISPSGRPSATTGRGSATTSASGHKVIPSETLPSTELQQMVAEAVQDSFRRHLASVGDHPAPAGRLPAPSCRPRRLFRGHRCCRPGCRSCGSHARRYCFWHSLH